MNGHNAKVNQVSYNNESNMLISAGDDGALLFWDLKNLRDHKPIQNIKKFKDSVTSLIVRDFCIFTACIDGHCRCFDIRLGKCIDDNIYHPLTSVSINKNENFLLLSCLDDTIRLIDRSDASQLQTYKGHIMDDCIITSCFSYDDYFVLSGSSNGLIHCWDLIKGKQVSCFKGHNGPITKVKYHPMKSMFFTCGVDGIVNVWKS